MEIDTKEKRWEAIGTNVYIFEREESRGGGQNKTFI